MAVASLAWHTEGRSHGGSGTSEGRCDPLPSDHRRWIMAGELKPLQHKHMLPACVQQTASGARWCSAVFVFRSVHRRLHNTASVITSPRNNDNNRKAIKGACGTVLY